MKDSKEIVENILRLRSSDYELADHSEIATSSKAILLKKEIEKEANVLLFNDEIELPCENEESRAENHDALENIESYQPCQELHFEVSEVKEGFEKKKKRRNYIEFRPEYSKIA